jgi:hypothetical protein
MLQQRHGSLAPKSGKRGPYKKEGRAVETQFALSTRYILAKRSCLTSNAPLISAINASSFFVSCSPDANLHNSSHLSVCIRDCVLGEEKPSVQLWTVLGYFQTEARLHVFRIGGADRCV